MDKKWIKEIKWIKVICVNRGQTIYEQVTKYKASVINAMNAIN